jgi:hypothetical protein
VDKETFDKKVAAIWSLYDAAKSLNSFGIATHASNEAVEKMLCQHTAALSNALADALEAKPQAA